MKDNTLVFIKNDTPLTTSRTVAEKFGKNHQHVMRDIRTLIQQMGGVSNFGQTPMFTETTWTNEQNGQTYPQYLMTRDGFALLAMGCLQERTRRPVIQDARTCCLPAN